MKQSLLVAALLALALSGCPTKPAENTEASPATAEASPAVTEEASPAAPEAPAASEAPVEASGAAEASHYSVFTGW